MSATVPLLQVAKRAIRWWSAMSVASAVLLAPCVGLGAQELTLVKIANVSTTVSFAPLLLADVVPEIFAKQGIKTEISDLRGSSPNCVAAVLSRAVDACYVGNQSPNNAIVEGAPLRLVAETTRPASELFLSDATIAKLGVSPTASTADRLRALKGLKIGTSAPGTTHYTFLSAMLQAVGMKISDVQMVTVTDPVAMVESVRNNQINGAMWSPGSLGNLTVNGGGKRWASTLTGDAPMLEDQPFIGLYVHQAFLDKNPTIGARLHAAFAEAVRRVKQDPENSSRLIKAKFFPDADKKVWDDAFAQTNKAFIDGAKVTRAGWEKLLKLQTEDTKKDYSKAAYELVVLPVARAD
jgi:ABC-type nitrate/sulfonate/bicarbonate transport system substrate-binding protein